MQHKMPTLFIAHGSPMNAIQRNAFTDAIGGLGRTLPRPSAVLVISAHWRTTGTRVLNAAWPETIHDFSGFPEELFRVRYPAPGSPATANRIVKLLEQFGVKDDPEWGLDHGTWSVLRHIYPGADIPTVQLSLNRRLDLAGHLALAQMLAPLRDEGVLILGSGNITHNLGEVDFNEDAKPVLWAEQFDQRMALAIEHRDVDFLLRRSDPDWAALWRRALPTSEHYIPFLYAFGASDESDLISFPYQGIQNGTLSMRCVQFGT
jgi:4,5-DOPA dioxygenase extradiol